MYIRIYICLTTTSKVIISISHDHEIVVKFAVLWIIVGIKLYYSRFLYDLIDIIPAVCILLWHGHVKSLATSKVKH